MVIKFKARIDVGRDAGARFEGTGIDYEIADETHIYKNLATDSKIAGVAIESSNLASDLRMKLGYLRSQGRERVATGAMATLMSDSVAEA